MDNAIHVEIEVVELLPIGVWPGCVDWDDGTIFHSDRLAFNHWGNDLWVLVGKPTERRRNTHLDDVGMVNYSRAGVRSLARWRYWADAGDSIDKGTCDTEK